MRRHHVPDRVLARAPRSARLPQLAALLALVALPAVTILPLVGCGGAEAPRLSDLDGTWAGRLQTQGGSCPDVVPSTLVVSDRRLVFTPGGGVLTLDGQRTPQDETLHAQALLRDMNHKPLPLVFEGRAVAETEAGRAGLRIDGTYGTPTCRAAITLRRPVNHPWRNLMGR
jgi:hypothetical protein